MNKNVKGIIVVAIVGGIGYYLYKKTFNPSTIVIKQLDKDYGVNINHKKFVDSADKGYIKAWAKAIKNGSPSFFYNGGEYWTQGGSATKRK